jgi:hypothetical protein
VGIHLLQCQSLDDLPKKTEINPRDNHISFQVNFKVPTSPLRDYYYSLQDVLHVIVVLIIVVFPLQCPDMFLVEKRLQEMDIKYKKRVVEDGGLYVDQLFFHDPDGYMIEICNCENLPVIPVRSTSSVRSTSLRFSLPQSNPKLEREDSRSEIALVPMNAATAQMDFTSFE